MIIQDIKKECMYVCDVVAGIHGFFDDKIPYKLVVRGV